jgi:hypothetical protein
LTSEVDGVEVRVVLMDPKVDAFTLDDGKLYVLVKALPAAVDVRQPERFEGPLNAS